MTSASTAGSTNALGASSRPSHICTFLKHIQSLLTRGRLWRVDRLGNGVRVRGAVLVENRGTMILGPNVRIWSHVHRTQLSTGPGATLEIGRDSFVNCGTTISARTRVSIGCRVQIANLVTIMDSDFHGVEDRDHPEPPQPVVIEDDAWVATKATILKGVRIGRGAVVAAGAVVTRDVAPYTLVGGVPARLIRPLSSHTSSGGEQR